MNHETIRFETDPNSGQSSLTLATNLSMDVWLLSQIYSLVIKVNFALFPHINTERSFKVEIVNPCLDSALSELKIDESNLVFDADPASIILLQFVEYAVRTI